MRGDGILVTITMNVAVADIGFLEGVDFGNLSEQSDRALKGSGLTEE